jgi:hypothetical protein
MPYFRAVGGRLSPPPAGALAGAWMIDHTPRVDLRMRTSPLVGMAVVMVVLGIARSSANAVSACGNNSGYAPRANLVLPQRPRVVYFDDQSDPGDETPAFFARIGGKTVPIKVTTTHSDPYTFHVIEIDSDKTGKLEIGEIYDDKKYVAIRYKIKASAQVPTALAGATKRFHQDVRHSTVSELFDGMAVALDDKTPALTVHVKLRRDASSSWYELDAPVIPGDWMDAHTVVKLGKLGCTANYTVDLLEKGVDIEMSATMVDGTTVPIDLPQHVSL